MTRSGRTGAEILAYFFGFPRNSVATLRFDFFEVHRQALAGLNARRVAGKQVNPFVFIAGHQDPVLVRNDTSCNRPIGRGLVDKDNGHDNEDSDNGNGSRQSAVRVRLQLIRVGRRGECHAEKADQRYAPKVF